MERKDPGAAEDERAHESRISVLSWRGRGRSPASASAPLPGIVPARPHRCLFQSSTSFAFPVGFHRTLFRRALLFSHLVSLPAAAPAPLFERSPFSQQRAAIPQPQSQTRWRESPYVHFHSAVSGSTCPRSETFDTVSSPRAPRIIPFRHRTPTMSNKAGSSSARLLNPAPQDLVSRCERSIGRGTSTET